VERGGGGEGGGGGREGQGEEEIVVGSDGAGVRQSECEDGDDRRGDEERAEEREGTEEGEGREEGEEGAGGGGEMDVWKSAHAKLQVKFAARCAHLFFRPFALGDFDGRV